VGVFSEHSAQWSDDIMQTGEDCEDHWRQEIKLRFYNTFNYLNYQECMRERFETGR